MVKHLRAMTSLDLREGKDRVQLCSRWAIPGVFGACAPTPPSRQDCRRFAAARSGPRTGLRKFCSACSPGRASCGKVNPSIPEMVNQSLQVIATIHRYDGAERGSSN